MAASIYLLLDNIRAGCHSPRGFVVQALCAFCDCFQVKTTLLPERGVQAAPFLQMRKTGGKLSEHVELFQIKVPRNQDFCEKLHLKKPSYVRASKKLNPVQNNTVFFWEKTQTHTQRHTFPG